MKWREKILRLPQSVVWLLCVCLSFVMYLAIDPFFHRERPIFDRLGVSIVWGILFGTSWWFANRKEWRQTPIRFDQIQIQKD